MDVTLLVPVLNELHGLQKIMPTVPAGVFTQILIVDGGSKDGSAEWARENGYDVYVQKHPGLRYAYREAWTLIRGEYVITFSPDGNCKTEDLKPLVDKLSEGYDMVIASRYLDDAKSDDDSWLTGFGNWMFTNLINLLHGARYTDAMTIYRGYRTRMFYELDLDQDSSYWQEGVFGAYAGIEPLISVRAAKRKLRLGEVPSDEPARISGESKMMAFRWGSIFLLMLFTEVFQWRARAQKQAVARAEQLWRTRDAARGKSS